MRFACKELEKEYHSLKKDHKSLYKTITKTIEKLKSNRIAGKKIQKDKVSKRYTDLYGTNHFWKINLSKEWRLIYTITGDHIRILTIILSWYTDHKTYTKEMYK